MKPQASLTQEHELQALADRLRQLEDMAALHALKTRYARAADAKYTLDGRRQAQPALAQAARAQADCFTTDGIWEGGAFGGTLTGRDALYENFLRAPWRYAMHFYQAPELRLLGDEAAGSWLLWQIGVRENDGHTLLLHGRTCERYRRTPQGWLINHMRFDSLHSLSITDVPDALRRLIPAFAATQT